MKVFILDSNKRVLAEAEAYLETMSDIEIIGTADNGIDGTKEILEKHPEVVIMDLTLVGVDGLEVLESMKVYDDIKVLITTSVQTENILDKAFGLGADYVLIKPYRLEVLYKRLRDIMSEGVRRTIEGYNKEDFARAGAVDIRNVKQSIMKLLRELNITPNLKGFRYLRTAISMVVEQESVIESVTKVIYPEIARQYNTTPVRAERAIRHAIESSWEKDGGTLIKNTFGLRGDAKRPTNSEFIGLASEFLKS